MKLSIISSLLAAAAVTSGKFCPRQFFILAALTIEGYTFTRLDKNNAALLVVDHQLGLSELVRDYDPTVFRQSIIAHAALGNLFNLPTILTTSADTGPNGALPKEVTDVYSLPRSTGV